jgi:hypothetical protein
MTTVRSTNPHYSRRFLILRNGVRFMSFDKRIDASICISVHKGRTNCPVGLGSTDTWEIVDQDPKGS